jgi:1-acyl-sn-glycerol-3-phosphate acyltransferase
MAKKNQLNQFSPKPKIVRYLVGYFGLLLGALIGKISIKGRHHIPKSGPFIVASNHFSYIDPFLVVFAIRRAINFIAASDQEVKWHFMWALHLYGFIPVNRQNVAPSTIKDAKKVLNQGKILGLFPEGHITNTELNPAKNGVVYLSTVEKAPILPMVIWGAENAWENLFKGVRPQIEIRIGRPFGPYILPKEKAQKKQAIQKIGNEMIHQFAALLPNSRHGVFKGNKRILNLRKKHDLPDPV